ncbi:hypothetical protein ACP3V5_17840 [Vibrio maritimus]
MIRPIFVLVVSLSVTGGAWSQSPLPMTKTNSKTIELTRNEGKVSFSTGRNVRYSLMSKQVGIDTLYAIRDSTMAFDRIDKKDWAFMASMVEKPSIAVTNEHLFVAGASYNVLRYLQIPKKAQRYHGKQYWNSKRCELGGATYEFLGLTSKNDTAIGIGTIKQDRHVFVVETPLDAGGTCRYHNTKLEYQADLSSEIIGDYDDALLIAIQGKVVTVKLKSG